MNTLHRGDLVLLRSFGQKPIIRRVWDVYSDCVTIHDEEQYQRHIHNAQSLNPVEFEWSAVFIADEALAERISHDHALWSEAMPLKHEGLR